MTPASLRLRPGLITTRLAIVVVLCVTRAAYAQESLLPATSWATAPSFTSWRFATPLSQSVGAVKSITELSVPIGARAQLGRFTFDFRAAAAMSGATLEAADGSTRKITLNGVTDVRVRMSVPVVGEGLVLTAALNAPTGTTGLDADQTAVQQLIGAPGLALPVTSYGVGFGGTLGFVGARQFGPWALAVGGSLEERAEYTPIELALTGGASLTKIKPGVAGHVTIGADRPVGAGRVSLLLIADVFTLDDVTTGTADGGVDGTSYKLGPQLSAIARVEMGIPGWRESSVGVSFRHRSAFADAGGATVAGSEANYVDGGFVGVHGGAQGRGLLLGVDARWQSGMSVTDALVAASMAAGGLTVGMEWPMSRTTARLAARVQVGTFDTGAARSSANALSLSLSLSSRGRVQ
jgi:hypothetical protein